jgi:acyl-CoA thioesterase
MNRAEILLANDPASQMLGINIVELNQGYCKLTMRVLENMTNGYNVCHGGFIYTLADTACAFAGAKENKTILSSTGQIEYLAPAILGSELVAIAEINCISGRNIFCDVKIYDENKKTISLYRGKLIVKNG